jgi:hypothetical protein
MLLHFETVQTLSNFKKSAWFFCEIFIQSFCVLKNSKMTLSVSPVHRLFIYLRRRPFFIFDSFLRSLQHITRMICIFIFDSSLTSPSIYQSKIRSVIFISRFFYIWVISFVSFSISIDDMYFYFYLAFKFFYLSNLLRVLQYIKRRYVLLHLSRV